MATEPRGYWPATTMLSYWNALRGPSPSPTWSRNGRDDEACRVLCAVAARLHAPRPEPLPELIPLPHWFRELEPAAATHGGILARCAETAHVLLAEPREGTNPDLADPTRR